MPRVGIHGIWGWKPQIPDARDLVYDEYTKYPALIDLPTVQDLRPYCPPVYDQGPIGSCTANAACGAFEYGLMRQGLTDFHLSRLFQYYNSRLLEGDTDQDAGATIRDANKALARYGACPESVWPYDERDVLVAPPGTAYAVALPNKITQYASVPQDLIAMKNTLFEMLPIQIGFTVYTSFESDQVAQTGIVPMPDLKSESLLGGHAVLIVGYADTFLHPDGQVLFNVFIVRNSWGSSWGDQGYFYMPYEYFTDPNLASDFWVIQWVP